VLGRKHLDVRYSLTVLGVSKEAWNEVASDGQGCSMDGQGCCVTYNVG
jgi:hypothetical protein